MEWKIYTEVSNWHIIIVHLQASVIAFLTWFLSSPWHWPHLKNPQAIQDCVCVVDSNEVEAFKRTPVIVLESSLCVLSSLLVPCLVFLVLSSQQLHWVSLHLNSGEAVQVGRCLNGLPVLACHTSLSGRLYLKSVAERGCGYWFTRWTMAPSLTQWWFNTTNTNPFLHPYTL